MKWELSEIHRYLSKWQDILRLRDWDIEVESVDVPWRKTGDIKIDMDDRKAVLMINNCDPKQENLEALIIHELLHLKLWGMDSLTENLINALYGEDEADQKREILYTQYMTILESTTEDLAKAFLCTAGEDKAISFGRVRKQVLKELKKE